MIRVLACFNSDALGRADRRAEITGNTFGTVVRNLERMQPAKSGGYYRFLFRILKRYSLLEEMTECYLQTFYQGYYHVRILSTDSVGNLIKKLLEQRHPDGIPHNQEQGDRQENLPSELHQLVITVARIGGTYPHADKHQYVYFGDEV